MARRKTADVEVLPPDEPPKRTRKKLVEAKHVVTYDDVIPVEVADEPEELIEIGDYESAPARRPKAKNERDELRKKLSANNVTPGSDLKLSIERYMHSDSGDGGTWAETEFCTKYACAESHITNEDYLDVARKWGVGKYRLTLRMNNKIVTAWDKRISASTMPVMNGATMNGMEGVPPPMAYQVPPGGVQTPLTFQDYLKQMVQTKKLMDEISGTVPIPPQQSEEVALASLLLKDPANAKRMARNLLGGEGEKDMMALAIENGPAIIEAFGNMVLKIIGDVRSTNGQAQMGNPQQSFNHAPQSAQSMLSNPMHQNAGEQRADGVLSIQTNEQAAIQNTTQNATAPDEQILTHLFNYVIEQCRTQTAPELVAAGIDRFMDEQVGNDFPLYFDKVWSQLENFAGMDAEIVLAYVKTLPGGATVADMPHAKDWLIKLQELLKPEPEASA